MSSITTSPGPVAVIDIGSNSIKLLVATRDPAGRLQELLQHTKETRIGSGITGNPPHLGAAAMAQAITALQALLATAAACTPATVRLVATSAVRDAANGAEFAARVRESTGHSLDILSGSEEARLIGRGIACESMLRDVPAFYVFDLGGGSLEALAFRGGRVEQAVSLQLGCVRVTEACVQDPTQPLSAGEANHIRTLVDRLVAESGFRFDLPPEAIAVATGGTATTVRTMRAAAWGRALAVESPVLAVTELRRFCAQISELPLHERRRLPGLPEARADVFPAAMVTLIEMARLASVDALRHSLYNLRYGLASELLGVA